MQLRLEAEIIPNQSLGGLTLRTKLRDIQELITGLGISKKGSFNLVTPFEARYCFGNGELTVSVDVRNGKIFKLTANSGYTGKLFGKIVVGMRVEEAMKLEPRLFYDEAEALILCTGIKGLAIDVPVVDPTPELVPKMTIAAISVYAAEIGTLQGNDGDW